MPVFRNKQDTMLVSRKPRSGRRTDKDISVQGGHCWEGQGQLLGEEDAQDVREGEGGTWSFCAKQCSPPPRCSSFRTDQLCHSDDPLPSVSAAVPSVGLPKATWLNSAAQQRSGKVIDGD